jgi:hypothetical protein
MPRNKTLKALRKEQDRQQLSEQGYNVIKHRYTAYDVNVLLQLSLNYAEKRTGNDIATIFNCITTQLYNYKNTTRVNEINKKGKIIDEKSVCLSLGVPAVNALNCPHCNQVIELDSPNVPNKDNKS